MANKLYKHVSFAWTPWRYDRRYSSDAGGAGLAGGRVSYSGQRHPQRQFCGTRGEEARRAAEAGAQAALAHIQAGTSPAPAWLYSPSMVGPIPWQSMGYVDSEFQVLHIDHTVAPPHPAWIVPGNPGLGLLPSVTLAGSAPAGAVAGIPAGAQLHYLYSTGCTRSGHSRTVGLFYTTAPSLKVLSWQIF